MKKAATWAGGIAPVNSATTAPSLNALTAGMPWMPKVLEMPGIGVDVDLGEVDVVAAPAGLGLERGGELAAGAAPLGPEVDDHRHLVRAVEHVGLEAVLCDVADHRP